MMKMTVLPSENCDRRSPAFDGASCVDHVAEDGGVIELSLKDLRQLFDSMDPSPFRERDLDVKAEEFIVDSARELLTRAPLKALVIHLDQPIGLVDESHAVGDAVRTHFARRSRLFGRDLHQLLRRGFISLAIGVVFLTVLFVISRLTEGLLGDSAISSVMREGLLIVGWVAMWRPLEIFLYDWWPILGDQRLYDHVSRITVQIVYAGSRKPDAKEAAMALIRWEGEGGSVLNTKPSR
jgi:hypothetical protein